MPHVTADPAEKAHTPRAFYKIYSDQFPAGMLATYRALQYHLTRRRENGLLSAGAVQETRLGLVVYPARFLKWLLIERPTDPSGSQNAA